MYNLIILYNIVRSNIFKKENKNNKDKWKKKKKEGEIGYLW